MPQLKNCQLSFNSVNEKTSRILGASAVSGLVVPVSQDLS